MASVSKGSSDPNKRKQEAASKSKGKVGDWCRHISSSGKEYYFNIQTHASQWEKPPEWLEYEKKYGPVPSSHPTPSKPTQQQQQRAHHQQQQQQQQQSSSSDHSHSEQREKEQQSHRHNVHTQQHGHSSSSHHHFPTQSSSTSSGHPSSSSSSTYQGGQTYTHNFNASKPQSSSHPHVFHHSLSMTSSSSRSSSQAHDHSNLPSSSSSTQKHYPESLSKHPTFPQSSLSSSVRDSRKQSEDLQTEDMDISPLDDNNSPVHEKITSNLSRDRMDSYKSHSDSLDSRDRDRDRDPRDNRDDSKNIPSSSSSSMMHHRGGNNGWRDRDRDHRYKERERDSPRRDYRERDRDRERERERDMRDRDRDRERERERDRDRDRDYRDSRDGRDNRGRPRDRDNRERERDRERSRSKLRDERSRSPWERDGTPERHDSNSGGGICSLSSLTALNPPEKAEDPLASMAKYYREDLIEHIKNPQADAAEKQANKLSEETLMTTAVLLSKVSTELKMARGLVRLTEIQATLQEQRILFLREQIKTLQESDKDPSSQRIGLDSRD